MTSHFDKRGQVLECDELDALLSSYFAAEMPKAWPELAPARELPSAVALKGPRRRFTSPGRYALAASLLLLLAGQLYLSGLFSNVAPARSDRDSGQIEASRRKSDTRLTRPLPAKPLKSTPVRPVE